MSIKILFIFNYYFLFLLIITLLLFLSVTWQWGSKSPQLKMNFWKSAVIQPIPVQNFCKITSLFKCTAKFLPITYKTASVFLQFRLLYRKSTVVITEKLPKCNLISKMRNRWETTAIPDFKIFEILEICNIFLFL